MGVCAEPEIGIQGETTDFLNFIDKGYLSVSQNRQVNSFIDLLVQFPQIFIGCLAYVQVIKDLAADG